MATISLSRALSFSLSLFLPHSSTPKPRLEPRLEQRDPLFFLLLPPPPPTRGVHFEIRGTRPSGLLIDLFRRTVRSSRAGEIGERVVAAHGGCGHVYYLLTGMWRRRRLRQRRRRRRDLAAGLCFAAAQTAPTYHQYQLLLLLLVHTTITTTYHHGHHQYHKRSHPQQHRQHHRQSPIHPASQARQSTTFPMRLRAPGAAPRTDIGILAACKRRTPRMHQSRPPPSPVQPGPVQPSPDAHLESGQSLQGKSQAPYPQFSLLCDAS